MTLSIRDESIANAHHSGTVGGVRVVGSTDRSASRCGNGMAARAAARGRMPTSATSTANAATSIRIDC
jgi:hypothetical protein